MSKYYSTKKIRKEDAQYNIVLGERTNGKSYAVKSDALILAWKEKKCKFAIIRRRAEDIKNKLIEDYFEDMVQDKYIHKLTGGEYDAITVWQGVIYFSKNENGKTVKSFPIGRVFSVSTATRYKSTQYPDIDEIIYEEFITDELYLKDEVKIFMNLVSTIARDRKVKVWLIGNNINVVCPFFNEWSLHNIPNMPQGQIDIYNFSDVENNTVKIAVEYCGNAEKKKSGMFFGNIGKNIDKGEWQTHEHPHLIGELKDYEKIYALSLEHSFLYFNIDLLIKDGFATIYVYPTKQYKMRKRLLTENYIDDIMNSRCLNKSNKAECLINDLFNKKRICFSHNLCGENFYNAIKNMEICPFNLL